RSAGDRSPRGSWRLWAPSARDRAGPGQAQWPSLASTEKRAGRISGCARRLCSVRFRIRAERTRMATLAFNAEEIAPRELKPSLYELDGISRQSVEAHYKLYQGYVGKRNEILGKLAEVDLSAANQVYSELRALKVDLSFAVGGVKNHEVYFEHLGGDGGAATGAIAGLIEQGFGSFDSWKADLKATGMAGRGWAWAAYEWDEGRLVI